MKIKTIYILNSNHVDKSQITDFINYYHNFNYKIKFLIANQVMKNCTNLIMEEFNNKNFVDELIQIKKNYPQTIIGCIFTEYLTKGYQTFNNFNRNKIINFLKYVIFYPFTYKIAPYILKADIFLYKRNTFKKKRIESCAEIILNYYNKILLGISNFYYFRSSFYFYYRYRNFYKIRDIFDFYLCWNNNQKKIIEKTLSKKTFFFIPKINFIKQNKNIGISVSGSKTPYRKRLLESLNIKIINNFEDFINGQSFHKKKKFFQYSLNPGKLVNWNEPSLIRYVMSASNNEIPIIIDRFSDKIYTNSCLYFKLEKLTKSNFRILKDNYDFFLKKINKQIKKYNKKATFYNKPFVNYITSNNNS
jgi:hypothetical protein